jgi:CRISPR/Cas system CSM-associated protein Csm3 (group 7 of RAMP superfamily)
MSNEQQTQATATTEPTKGSRCNECHHCNYADHVGLPSAGDVIKHRWKSEGKGKSLKQFVRTLLIAKDLHAQEWVSNKLGEKNEERSEKNKARVQLERVATKASRKATKTGSKSSAA